MKLPKLPKIDWSKLNTPTAYSTYAIIGVVTTTVLAIAITKRDCRKRYCEKFQGDIFEKQITKEEVIEEVKDAVKTYAPVLASTAATIFCIKKADQKWMDYNGLINASYLAARSQAARYRALAAPAVGAEIVKGLNGQKPEEGVQWFCIEDPRSWKPFFELHDEEDRFSPDLYSEQPRIYFQSTVHDVDQAKYWINRSLALRGSASVRELFTYLGILDRFPEEYEDRLGWDVNEMSDLGYDYWIDFEECDPILDPSTGIYITPIYYLVEPGYSPDYTQLAWDYKTTSIYESNYGGPPYRMHPTE